jgi:hypothetical protein
MKHGIKLLIAAVLSLSIGVAFAAPLFVADMTIEPWTGLRQGPRADFAVSTVYADFSVQENAVPSSRYPGSNASLVNYYVVLNVTNLSNVTAKIGSLSFGAAKDITVELSALGSENFLATGGPQRGTGLGEVGTEVEGLWIDDQWTNVTWIPGNAEKIFDIKPHNGANQWSFTTAIPSLPDNANQTGTFTEGLPIREYVVTSRSGEMRFYTAVYLNGSWVDVTGRFRVEYPKPNVMASDALFYERLYVVSDSYYNAIEPMNVTNRAQTQGMSVVWAEPNGFDGFNKFWQPNESRLITLQGYREVDNTGGFQALKAGDVMLYAAASSYLKDRIEMTNGSYVDTYSTAFELKPVHLEQNQNSYRYNAILGSDQTFQPDQWGVEVFIKQGS